MSNDNNDIMFNKTKNELAILVNKNMVLLYDEFNRYKYQINLI